MTSGSVLDPWVYLGHSKKQTNFLAPGYPTCGPGWDTLMETSTVRLWGEKGSEGGSYSKVI